MARATIAYASISYSDIVETYKKSSTNADAVNVTVSRQQERGDI